MTRDVGALVTDHMEQMDRIAPPITAEEIRGMSQAAAPETSTHRLGSPIHRGLLVALVAAVMVLVVGTLTAVFLSGTPTGELVVTTGVQSTVTSPPPTISTTPATSSVETSEAVVPPVELALTWHDVPDALAERLYETGYSAGQGGAYPVGLADAELMDNVFAVDSGFLTPQSQIELLFSTDGAKWQSVASPARVIHDIAQAGRWVVIAGQDGNGDGSAWRSRDGIAWDRLLPPSNLAMLAGSQWTVEALALLEGGQVFWVLRGDEGSTAQVVTIVSEENLAELPSPPWEVSFDATGRIVDGLGGAWLGVFAESTVASGFLPQAWWRLDHETWVEVEPEIEITPDLEPELDNESVRSVCEIAWKGPLNGSAIGVASGHCNWLTWRSTDGINWILAESVGPVERGESMWFAFRKGLLLSSPNGIYWDPMPAPRVPGEPAIGAAGDSVFLSSIDADGPDPNRVSLISVGRFEPA